MPIDAFMSRVDTSGGPDACWLWCGRKAVGSGYGICNRRDGAPRRDSYAHRVSYEMHVGPIPGGLFVCHTCDVPPCVNPRHLFLGTHADNMRDCVAKGRHWTPSRILRGERSSSAKLSLADVRAIRTLYTGKRGDLVRLARQFETTDTNILFIVRRRTWVDAQGRDL